MAVEKLSVGALKSIMNGSDVSNAVLQVLGVRKISSDKNRYRLLISDSINMIPWAMVSTQVAERYTTDDLPINTIICLKKYFTTCIKQKDDTNQRVIVVLEMEVVQSAEEVGSKIGNPVVLEFLSDKKENKPSNVPKTTETSSAASNSKSMFGNSNTDHETRPFASGMKSSNVRVNVPDKNDSKSTLNTSASEIQLCDQPINLISTLNPYINKWVIRAKVISKSNMRTWSNSRGEGKVFSVDLADKSAEIRMTLFTEEADKYFDMLQVDSVYYVSRCTVKIANKQFNSVNNQFELTVSKYSLIQPCLDENIDLPETKYNFTPIEKIITAEKNTIIDVIGVCKSVSNTQNLRSRNNDRELVKRDVLIQDDTNTCISLTLWGDEAEKFEAINNPVIALKSVRVTEFSGSKHLSTISSTVMKMDPDISEAHRIKGWYENYGNKEEGKNISLRSGGAGAFGPCEWKSFGDLNEFEVRNLDNGIVFQTKGIVLTIRSNRSFYKACPSENCNKKVADLQNDMYRCEKCNIEYEKFKYRLLTTSHVADYYGSQWLQMFNEECEKVLKITAQEFGETYESSEMEAANICDKAHFSEFIFKCRTKMDTFNDEPRLRTSAIRVEPINFKEYNNYLVTQIKKITDSK